MRRHGFDGLSFIFGLSFVAIGLLLLGGTAVRDGLALAWAGPLVAIGLAILIVAAARPRPGSHVSANTGGEEPEGDAAPGDEAAIDVAEEPE
ncbi:MAG: hypothetical protein L0227_08145 [Chloroflexi bacterium]|nr:hypothetical protein [Chloroflexota bacterium]